jgi:hypothetical protein
MRKNCINAKYLKIIYSLYDYRLFIIKYPIKVNKNQVTNHTKSAVYFLHCLFQKEFNSLSKIAAVESKWDA